MKRILFFLILILLSANGCAYNSRLPAADHSDPAAIRKRVQELWTAKKEKRWDRAYRYYCKNIRQKKSEADFVKSSNLDTESFSIVSIDSSDNYKTAEVVVSFDSKAFGVEMKNIRIKEEWLKEGSEWYACPSKSGAKSLFQ